MTKSDIAGILEIVDQAENFKPVVEQIITVLKSYGPELTTMGNMCNDAITKQKMRMFTTFISNGFSREEALHLTANTFTDISNRATYKK